MRSWSAIAGVVVVCVLLLIGGYVVWTWNDSTAAPTESVPVDAAAPQQQDAFAQRGGRGGGAMGRPGGFGGDGGFGGGFGLRRGADFARDRETFAARDRDTFAETISILGEASLSPDFGLTQEQRQKIQAIREEAKSAGAQWHKDHAEELKKLSDDIRAAGEASQRDKFRELVEKRQQLVASAPTAESATAKLKAVLTPDQLKMLDATAAQKRAAEEEIRQRAREMLGGDRAGFGGFGGRRGNPGAPGAQGAPAAPGREGQLNRGGDGVQE